MSKPRPRFSIIVPALAAPAQIAECLDAIGRLAVPDGGFEVIVVDDGSPQPLDGVVQRYRKCLDLTLIRQPNQGPAAARNAASQVARGDLLAFTDADCAPARDWLTALADRFERSPDHMLGGHTINQLTQNPYAETSQLIIDASYAFYNRTPEAAQFFASNNLAIAAARFREVGCFDAGIFRDAAEDRELCDRWRRAGHPMTYVPEAVVYHSHRLTFAAFCRQHFNYGRGAWNYHYIRTRRDGSNLRDDLRIHFRMLGHLRAPLAQLPYPHRFRMAPLLALWQAANGAGFCYEAWRTRASRTAAKRSYATP